MERYFWLAYQDLSTERQVGMQAGPIRWSAIVAYHARNPVVGLEVLTDIIRKVDRAYMDHLDGDEG